MEQITAVFDIIMRVIGILLGTGFLFLLGLMIYVVLREMLKEYEEQKHERNNNNTSR